MFTIKSTSPEGIYYLVNGWEKHKKFWIEKNKIKPTMLFNREQDAKRSLTKLLKITPEYSTDDFEMVSF